ncbi:hypothetical protein LBMAG42_23590 [Deltaproteobacteria bacterium]|nr:hypothetical protein LBMAG42_23590 [Deltaproteobacteria bacterium]
MTGVLWALGAGLVYAAIALRFPDRYPFATYSMYAKLRDRVEGAVLYVRVGEELVSIGALEAFAGLDAALVTPKGYPCSQEWVVWETRRWIEANLATEARPDAVDVEVGFRILRVENFVLHERCVVLASGRASWRSR